MGTDKLPSDGLRTPQFGDYSFEKAAARGILSRFRLSYVCRSLALMGMAVHGLSRATIPPHGAGRGRDEVSMPFRLIRCAARLWRDADGRCGDVAEEEREHQWEWRATAPQMLVGSMTLQQPTLCHRSNPDCAAGY
jgi:hypothetical protein